MSQWRNDQVMLAHYYEILARNSTKIPFDGCTKDAAYARFISEMHSGYYARPLAIALSLAIRTKRYRICVRSVLNQLVLQLKHRVALKVAEIYELYQEVDPRSDKGLVVKTLDEVAPFTVAEVLNLIRSQSEELFDRVAERISQQHERADC